HLVTAVAELGMVGVASDVLGEVPAAAALGAARLLHRERERSRAPGDLDLRDDEHLAEAPLADAAQQLRVAPGRRERDARLERLADHAGAPLFLERLGRLAADLPQ